MQILCDLFLQRTLPDTIPPAGILDRPNLFGVELPEAGMWIMLPMRLKAWIRS